MAEIFKIDISGVEELQSKIEQYGEGTGQIIQEYLRDDGFKKIASHIPDLIHASGRRWKGKAASAATASYSSVFQGSVSGTELTVKSKSKYGYLYFPDDGSNTIRHAGNQQFALRGAEESTDDIISDVVQRLVAAFEG